MTIPAVLGGKPVRKSFLPYVRPYIDDDDSYSVAESLKGNTISMGRAVSRFEESFAAYTGARYAVAVSSGAAGMHIALMAAGIGPQEEVIVSPMARTGSINCVLYQKAVPIFTDISTNTMTLDPKKVSMRITDRTRAIIISHYGGFPCQLDALLDCGKKGLAVIEDATMSLGATYKEKMVGGYGDTGVFSFSGAQGVTTGEGGMVITDREDTYHWLNLFRDGGMVREKEKLTKNPGPWYRQEMQDLGYNYRMTDMQAALGLSQLKKASFFLSRRSKIAERYGAAFAKLAQIETIRPAENSCPSWDIYPIITKPQLLSVGRREIFNALLGENIGVDVNYLPVHMHPYYLWIGHPEVCTLEGSLCPVAEDIYENMICLPIYPTMSDRDTEDVLNAVIKIINHYRLDSL